jgi:spore coat protein U-like protein
MMIRIRARLAAPLVACLSAAHGASAATSCSVTSVTDLVFGNVDPTGTLVDTTATLNYRCSFTGILSGSSVTLCFNIGPGSGGTSYTPRTMKAGSEAMNYQIYSDAARSLVWGSSTAPGLPAVTAHMQLSALLGTSTQNGSLTLFGRVPAGQTSLATGAYSSLFTGNGAQMTYNASEGFLGPPAYPTTCTGDGSDNFDFQASASVASLCRIGTASDMNFGSAPSNFAANIDQQSAITMTCTRNTAWQVGLDNGQNALGTTRRMAGGTGRVAYELYRNSARNQRWGTTLNTDTLTGSGTGVAQALTVYGRVAPQAPMPAGAYSDKITVTVTY